MSEIPVEYEFVRRNDFSGEDVLAVVHVGVSGIASKLTLERQAHNCSYRRNDVKGLCPSEGKCVLESTEDVLKTAFDIDDLAKEVKIEVEVSDDPGRFLCDFVYYKSLWSTRGKALFIHVPDLNRPYSKERLAVGIADVLRAICRQKIDST